ncbi:hypothetical protein M3J09_009564 [Ascochyta lentis]
MYQHTSPGGAYKTPETEEKAREPGTENGRKDFEVVEPHGENQKMLVDAVVSCLQWQWGVCCQVERTALTL